MKYAIIIEKGKKSYGAYVPDLPGCVAVGKTKTEVLRLIKEAIAYHLEGMQKEGLSPSVSHSIIEYVEV